MSKDEKAANDAAFWIVSAFSGLLVGAATMLMASWSAMPAFFLGLFVFLALAIILSVLMANEE